MDPQTGVVGKVFKIGQETGLAWDGSHLVTCAFGKEPALVFRELQGGAEGRRRVPLNGEVRAVGFHGGVYYLLRSSPPPKPGDPPPAKSGEQGVSWIYVLKLP